MYYHCMMLDLLNIKSCHISSMLFIYVWLNTIYFCVLCVGSIFKYMHIFRILTSNCDHCASFVHRALKDIRKGRRMALHVLLILLTILKCVCILLIMSYLLLLQIKYLSVKYLICNQ